MRRLFVIRKDLNLSPGKLAAMVGHCCEAYWTNWIRQHTVVKYRNLYPCVDYHIDKETGEKIKEIQLYKRGDLYELSEKAYLDGKEYFFAHANEKGLFVEDDKVDSYYCIRVGAILDTDIYKDYIEGSFVKIICEAKNLNHLLKVIDIAKKYNLKEDIDYGLINDKCLTELRPENEDGTCTVGIWFKPLDDEIAHDLSKKYQLYH